MHGAIRLGTPTQSWQALVQEATERTGCPLDETRESHLVFVLLRYQREPWMLSRTQGIDWMQALLHERSVRAEYLREVGDRCLILAGLFPGVAQRRRVSIDYYVEIGRAAYRGVAEASQRAYAVLYDQLAHSYGQLVVTLQAVRPADTT